MNRRSLLKGLAAMPAASTLAAVCQTQPSHSQPTHGTLRVILNGPFGVALDSRKDFRITAYVPSDPMHEHELRFRGPMEIAGKESASGASPSYHFTLLPDGLEAGHGSPRIDQGFYDFNLKHIGNFELPPNPFVVVDLPRPDYITFTPPAQPVIFGGKTTLQPLDHILEYHVSNPAAVHIRAGDKDQKPLPCRELLEEYEKYWSTRQGNVSAQRSNMEEMLSNCSPSDLCVLFGVGLNPASGVNPAQHGADFFNNVLYPSFVRFGPEEQKPLKLQTISRCIAVDENAPSSAFLRPADFRYPTPQPHLLQVASVLDCQAGGIMGHVP